MICTKPCNIHKTFLYTIIDFVNDIRGTENRIFGMPVTTDKECSEMLERLTLAETDISHRNNIPLRVEKIILPTT